MFTNSYDLHHKYEFQKIVSIVDPQIEKNSLVPSLSEMEQTEEQKFKIHKYQKIDQIPQHCEPTENDKGIINLEWIKTMTSIYPSSIVYYYYLSSPNPKEEEKKIFGELRKIKDQYKEVPLFLFIMKNNFPFNIDTEGVENTCSLFRLTGKGNIYVLNSHDSLRVTEVKKLMTSLKLSTQAFYKKLKADILSIRDKTSNPEVLCKCDVKLAIISMIKSKKAPSSKINIFQRAYGNLIKTVKNSLNANKDNTSTEESSKVNIPDLSKYYFGDSTNSKYNYIEIKNVADWILFQIVSLVNDKNINSIVNTYDLHFNYFSKTDYYLNEGENMKNMLYTFEFFWRYQRFEELKNLALNINQGSSTDIMNKENAMNIIQAIQLINTQDTNFVNELIFTMLKSFYNMKRLVKLLDHFENLNLQTIEGNPELSQITIEKIKIKYNKFYEKVPQYEYNINPLTTKTIPFSEEIALKKLIIENNLTKDKMMEILTQNLTICFDLITKTESCQSLNLYLNIIHFMKDSPSSGNINEYLGKIYLKISEAKSLMNFPQVYYNFIQIFTDSLIKYFNEKNKITKQRRTMLIKNLIQLGNWRKLTENEEKIFNMLNSGSDIIEEDQSSTPQENQSETKEETVVQVNNKTNNSSEKKNTIIGLNLEIKGDENHNRRILELVQYEFTLNTEFEKENLNLDYVEIFFSNPKRPSKKFNNFTEPLSKNNPIKFEYKIMLKDGDMMLSIPLVHIKLKNNPQYIYEILIDSLPETTILLKNMEKNVLDFIPPKLIKIGNEQYYNCEIEITKDESYNVNIGKMDIHFTKDRERSSSTKKNQTNLTQAFKDLTPKTDHSKLSPNKSNTNTNSSTSMRAIFGTTSPSKVNKGNISPMKDMSKSTAPPKSATSEKNLKLIVLEDIPKESSETQISSFKTDNQQEVKFYYKENDTQSGESIIANAKDEYVLHIDNLEEYFKTKGNKISFLVKAKNIKDKGYFVINFGAKYQILQKEVDDDSIELKSNGQVHFQIIEPFSSKSDSSSNTYMTLQKRKIYPTNNNIMQCFTLTNNLETDVFIKKVNIEKSKDVECEIDSPLEDIINLEDEELKNNILLFIKGSDFNIPFNCVYSKQYVGVLGKVTVEWTTENLSKFSKDIFNKTVLELPELNVNKFNIGIDYNIIPHEEISGSFLCNIKIENRINKIKRMGFQTDTENLLGFNIQGFVKKNFILLPREIKEFKLILTPTQYGNLKLPSVKFMEYNMNGTDKLSSVYYFPDFLDIQVK